MKDDVLHWAAGHPTAKRPSKETLNHRGIIELVSGLDVYKKTAEAYRRAYAALGIDLINRVPLESEKALRAVPVGTTRAHPTLPYDYASLGVFDAAMRRSYLCKTVEDVWQLDVASLDYGELITPVPHSCAAADIAQRHAALGPVGLYYPMLYTTLFMWPVETLGWEVFLTAAATEPDRFHKHFLLPCAQKSKALVTQMVAADDSPFLFIHDDLSSATGPIFRPSWYRDHVFPWYPEIWSAAKQQGRKVIFVADGNMTAFLPDLIEAGVDGLMFENPATPLEAVIDHFGFANRFMIGGIETTRLAHGTPDEVRRMVLRVHEKTADCPGFAMASCGGLHGELPLANLEAYFDTRAEIGFTPNDWRTCCREKFHIGEKNNLQAITRPV
ncbi:MAG: hypothetical protein JXM70_02365 [Pirellulales bacterium]|nr:hypothetical protein [Pirellulales bacterium]